jgi:hypothetical protein
LSGETTHTKSLETFISITNDGIFKKISRVKEDMLKLWWKFHPNNHWNCFKKKLFPNFKIEISPINTDRIWLNLHHTLSISCITRQKWLNHFLSVFVLKKKIDKISLTLTMFVEYQKFKTAFPGLFNSFPIHSEAWVYCCITPNRLFQIVFIDIVWKTNYFKISNWNISNKHWQNFIKLAPYLEHILLNERKVIESFYFRVYSFISKNKIDKISLTLTMFVKYQKFKTV